MREMHAFSNSLSLHILAMYLVALFSNIMTVLFENSQKLPVVFLFTAIMARQVVILSCGAFRLLSIINQKQSARNVSKIYKNLLA